MLSNLTRNTFTAFIIVVFFTCCSRNVDFSKSKTLKLGTYNVINVSGCGDATLLIDELVNEGFDPNTFWKPNEKDVCKDESKKVVFKLNTKASLQNLNIYAKGAGNLKIGIKENELKDFRLQSGWNTLLFKHNTQYVFIELTSGEGLGEIVLEGTYDKPVVVKSPKLVYPKFADFMGVNAFVDDPVGAYAFFDNVREYHELDWHNREKGVYNFNPSFPGFDFDDYYHNFSFSNKLVCPVVQHSPFWLTNEKNTEIKPLAPGANATVPFSYQAHAEMLYRFVKKYDSVDLKYIENWNEPEKWWHGDKAYCSPYEYAAMSSQDWDGNLQKESLSISKAQPNTKLVMAGLSDLKSDYVNALKYWCDKNRGGNIPWSVVNAHVYANDPKEKKSLSPERFELDKKVTDFVLNSKMAMPAAAVWLTEFGYDRISDSPQAVPNIEGYSNDQVQAIWLLRSYLLLATTGLDKAFQYMVRDTKGKGLYMSSGLYNANGSKTVYHDSWFYLFQLRNMLGAYRFVKRIDCGNNDVYLLKFENDEHQIAYAAWAGADTKMTFDIALPLKTTSIKMFRFDFGNKLDTKLETANIKGTFKVSEKPFLLMEEEIIPKMLSKLNLDELMPNFTQGLFDEQANLDPLYDLIAKPNSPVEQKEIVVELKQESDLKYICLFDDQGQSEIEILVEIGGSWVPLTKLKLNLYKKWKTVFVGKKCTGVKIVHLKNTSQIGELVLYK